MVFIQIHVDGMACEGCSSSIHNMLTQKAESLGIVQIKEVSHEKKHALLEVNDSFDAKEVAQLISTAGYEYKGNNNVQ